jgi:hypothetical protein
MVFFDSRWPVVVGGFVAAGILYWLFSVAQKRLARRAARGMSAEADRVRQGAKAGGRAYRKRD